MNKSFCPLGDHLQHYWNRLNPIEKKMQLDEEALYSLTPQIIAKEITELIEGNIVVDAFCGAGGLTIATALYGKEVIAIDLDAKRLEMAKYNAKLFNCHKSIKFIQGDYLALIKEISCDSIILDPPWGGVDYNRVDEFKLKHFNPNGKMIIDLALKYADTVVMRLPKNFDFYEIQPYNCLHLQENIFNDRLLHYCVKLQK